MATAAFTDRREAGRLLGTLLGAYAGRDDVVVLALPRGGVPVAWEVAAALRAPLDVVIVRKLGAPGQEELAMGAIASGGALVLNDDVVSAVRPGRRTISRIVAAEGRELARRERLYRGDRPPPAIGGRTAIVVDDGLATGATMRVAVSALRGAGAARIVVAVPVGPAESRDELAGEADEVVCALTPRPFVSVGRWYRDFRPTSDDEVRALLADPPMARADDG